MPHSSALLKNASYSRFLLVLALLLPVSFLLCLLGWLNDENIVAGDGIIENTQAVFLFLAVVLHVQWLRSLARFPSLDAYIRIFLAFLCAAFMIRELDISDFLADFTGGPYHFWRAFEMSIRIFVGAFFLTYILFLLPRVPLFWQNRGRILRYPLVQMALMGCVFYLLSWPFDKKLFSFLPSEGWHFLLEGVVELWATLFLLAAALWPHTLEKSNASS